MRQKDTYKLHSSNYGVIVGRVLANDAFGIPNAKISIFIERDSDDTTEISNIYPYENITSNDSEGRRYNLLPDYSDDSCYKVVGTFPNKRYMLDDDSTLEVYDKYWKYTTVTNQAGDYMLLVYLLVLSSFMLISICQILEYCHRSHVISNIKDTT